MRRAPRLATFVALVGTAFPAPALAGPKAEPAVSPAALRAQLARFTAASRPNRSVGEPGHEAAFRFIRDEFERVAKASGGVVRIHSFRPDVDFAASSYEADFHNLIESRYPPDHPEFRKWKAFTDGSIAFVRGYRGREGRNLVLEVRGRSLPSEVVYVGAHYDTITHDKETMRFTPARATDGADDNASGVAALLALARELATSRPERTIRLVAFDYEEIFFLGSYALARDLVSGKLRWAPSAEKALGLFNLEMIGWSKAPLALKPVMKLYARAPEEKGAESDLRLAKAFQSAAAKLETRLRPALLQNGFNRSDNWSFWQAGLPAICITEDWEGDFNEANYHTSKDLPSTLNYDYLSEITRVTAKAVSELANPTGSTGSR